MSDRITLLEIVYLSVWGLLGVGIGFFLKSWLSVKTWDNPVVNPTRSLLEGDKTQLQLKLALQERQQLALSDLGQQGMNASSLAVFLKVAIPLIATTLNTRYCDLLERLSDGDTFCWRAGVGWQMEELEASSVMSIAESLSVKEPLIVTDWQQETRWVAAPWWKTHKIKSSLSVGVSTDGGFYGILSVHNTEQRSFSDSEITFLQAASYLIGLTITRYRQAEKSQLLERALNASNNGIIITDARQPNNPTIYVNTVFEQMTGYSAEEALGRNCRFLQGDDHEQFALKNLREAIAQGKPIRTILRNFRKNKTFFWNQLDIDPVFDDFGQLSHFIEVQRDITQERQQEEALRQSEGRFRGIFEQAAVGMALVNDEGRFILVNPGACRILGYRASELQQLRWQDITHPDDQKVCPETVLSGSFPLNCSLEKRYLRQDGSVVWSHVAISRVESSSDVPSHFIAVFTDISDRKRAEAERDRFFTLSLDMLCIAGFNGYFKRINPAFFKNLGYSQQELLSRPFIDFVHPDDCSTTLAELEGLKAGRETVNFVNRYRTKNGEYRWFAWTSAPDEEKALIYAAAHDITELKTIEEALKQSEATNRALFNAIPDLIFRYRADGTYIDFKPAPTIRPYVPPEQMIGKTISQLLPPEVAQPVMAASQQAIASEQPQTIEYQLFLDGEWHDYEARIVALNSKELIGIIRDITERKRIEQQLKESEEHLNSILNSLKDVVWSVTVDSFEYIYLNQAVETVYGRLSAEFQDNPNLWLEVVHPDDRSSVEQTYQVLVEQGISKDLEYRILRPDGQIRWIRDRAQLILDETGKPIRLDGIASDVTERKQSEETLREREEFFRLIFDLSPTGMAITDLEGKLIQVNPALCQMLGYTEAELLKRRCADITHPDDCCAEFQRIQQLIRGEISDFRVEKRYIRKKGEIINAILQVSLIRDPQGQPLRLLGQTVDISDRKQVETALQESEERLSRIISNITDGLIVVDEQGNVCFVNPAAENLFGRSQRELLEHPFGLPFVAHEITEIDIRHSSGTLITAEMRVADIIWEGKTAYLISLRNVTESYQAKQALAESEAKYRQIVETATEGIWVIDRDNQTTFVNQQMAKMLGYSVEEMLGQNLMAFMDEAEKMMANCYVERRRQGIAETHDFKFRRRDGTTLWAMLSTHPLFDSEQNYIGSLAMIADITERKRIEQALYESEQRLESILNSIQDVVWSASATTLETLFLNPATEKIYGYPIARFFEQKRLWFELIHTDDRERIEHQFQELLAIGRIEMEYRLVRPDGQVRWMYARAHVVYDPQGQPLRLDGIDSDITQRKEAEAQLQHNATHDSLTQLPNRLLFGDRLQHALAQQSRYHKRQFAVLILDLDEFKVINDSLGHMSGDELLLELARRLQTCLRVTDTLARLGGDEFAILLEEVNDIKDAIKIAERIHQALCSPFSLSNQEVFINTSIGIALSTADYKQPIEILRDADTAMYRAKALGKACYAIFDRQMHASAVTRLQLETDLRRAVERQSFQLHYQPIVSLTTGNLTGFEALIRWQHPQKGLISPAQFIPVAEETGLIIPMGEWIFLEACQQLKTWQERYPHQHSLQLSVNLSSKQLRDVHLIDKIDSIFWKTELNSRNLKVEITESLLMDNVKLATEVLLKLRERHIEICLDDFGTGYSSLSYLHRFPVNTLKIDRSFVMRMGPNDENAEIVRAIVSLAHILRLTVVAEGVETNLQLAQLRGLGCEQGQGYFFAQPLTASDAALLIEKSHCWELEDNQA